MHILFLVSEYHPLVKVGGLGDFAGSFTRVLAKRGHQVSVVMPGYRTVDRHRYPTVDTGIRVTVPIGDREVEGAISAIRIQDNLTVYLVEHAGYFDRESLFGTGDEPYPDNAERFLFFSRASLELGRQLGGVQVIQANDWHAAIALFYVKEFYRKTGVFADTGTVMTIHNLGYQGLFWHHDMHLLGVGWQYYTPDKLEFYDHINYLKSGIVYADRITTVSPSYAREIQSPQMGFGLDGVLRERSDRLSGILNGVDYGEWNPWTDATLVSRYSVRTLDRRPANREALAGELGLRPGDGRPLVTLVSRLSEQKGIDLIIPVFDMLMELGIQFVALGSGKPELEGALRSLEHRYKGDVVCWIGYSESLAHRIHAAGDLFLMPSRYEPCGLSQLYAMKYGNVPVVRYTGGLRDTVVDLDEGPDRATGFGFEYYSPYTLFEAVRNAVTIFREQPETFHQIRVNGMKQKFSWDRTVSAYLRVYRAARADAVRSG